MTAERTVIRLERTIPAPPYRVYRAWLDPGLLARWMAPGTLTVTRAEGDERPGGHYRIWHADAGAAAGGFDCELAELVPHQRIVFRWGFVGPERRNGPAFDSLLTITLREAPGRATRLTVHEGVIRGSARADGCGPRLPELPTRDVLTVPVLRKVGRRMWERQPGARFVSAPIAGWHDRHWVEISFHAPHDGR